ncbi:MAG TPA: CBS domain-containing protein [Thermoanaerobaculia bacterium]|nr:CBS domain-containing protein [Thermoanaerobaculia bacterium]
MRKTRFTVADLMTERVYSLTPEDSLRSLQELMWEHDIRHVPIVDRAGDLLGVVSQRDLARATDGTATLPLSSRNDLLRSTRVGSVMVEEVATAEPTDDIRIAAQTMFDNKYGCLPVVAGRRLVGILTESDFVRLLAEGE